MSLLLQLSTIALCISVVFGCSPGFDTWYDGWCYQMRYEVNGYVQAEKDCTIDGLAVISIHSEQENRALQAAGNHATGGGHRSFYIGIGCDPSTNEFFWQDGSRVDYTNFRGGSGICDKGVYYYMTADGMWNATRSSDGFESNVLYIACRAGRSGGACEGWQLASIPGSSDQCIHTEYDQSSWEKAEEDCVERGAHLSSIHDSYTNDYLRRSAIGHQFTGGIHIGLRFDKSEGNYTWSDGSIVNYLHYAPDSPDPANGDCFSMQMYPKAGTWESASCKNARLPYICTRPVTSPAQQPPGCPAQKIYHAGDNIYSPNYPLPSGNSYCEYTLQAKENERIQLEFVMLEMNTCCDTLSIYDGNSTTPEVVSGYITDDLEGTRPRSHTNTLRFVFNSTDSRHTRGFHIKMHTYEFD